MLLAGCTPLQMADRLRRDFMAQSLVKQAHQRVRDGRADGRAVQLAAWATQLAPDDLPVLRAAATVFLAGRAWDRLLPALLTLRQRTGFADLYNLGVCYLYLGQEAQGEALLEAFLGTERSRHALHLISDRELAGVLNNVGYVYADAGVRLQQALALTQEAVRMAPDSGVILDSLGWAQYRLGQYDNAAFVLERALRLQRPPDAEIYYHAGTVHARMGRLRLAREELRRALALRDGDFPEAAEELRRMRWQLPPPQTA